MGALKAFPEGMRAYRAGDHARAAATLAPLVDRQDLAGRLARYYSAMAHRALGIEAAREGRFADAARRLRQASALVGVSADLAEYLLVVYAKAGRYGACADQAEVVARTHPDEAAAHARLAQAQWQSGRRPLAMLTLTQAIRRLGHSADLHLTLGLFHAAQDQHDQAAAHLRRATECDPGWAKAHYYLALVELAGGRLRQAVGALQRAWHLAPHDLLIAYQLCRAASAAAAAGRPVEVRLPEFPAHRPTSQIRQLAEYVAAEPDFVEAFLALPVSAADEDLFDLLISVLRTALLGHEGYADLHYLTAACLARRGDPEAARQHAARAVQINGRYVKALLQLAGLEAARGAGAQAVRCLRRAVRAGADWPDVHLRLGDSLAHAGQAASARRHYRRALTLNPRYHQAAVSLAALAA